jgi:hypothetical protein
MRVLMFVCVRVSMIVIVGMSMIVGMTVFVVVVMSVGVSYRRAVDGHVAGKATTAVLTHVRIPPG